jgi:hypothetical protein
MTAQVCVGARCAVHPARLAADSCPVCGRGRCAPDVSTFRDRGCAACTSAEAAVRPAGAVEVLTRAGLAGIASAWAGGWVATQHVGVHVMSILAPGLVGLAASWATSAAAGARPTAQRRAVLAVAAVSALLGTALAYRLFPLSPLHPLDQVGPPYLAALGGVLAWPLLFGWPGGRGGTPQDG